MNHEVLVVLDSYGHSVGNVPHNGDTDPGTVFLESFVGLKRDFRVTLLFMGGTPGAWLSDMAGGTDTSAVERARRAFHDKAQARLDDVADRLAAMGFQPENVSTRLRLRDFGSVHDVLAEVASGLFDAVLLGPGGVARFWDMLEDPANLPMLRGTVEFPLWLCHAVEPDRRNVLLCADGSEAADRAADHAGFMLDAAPDHAVTVCSVAPPGQEAEAEAHMARAVAQLTDNGVSLERVSMLALSGYDTVGAICSASEKGRFAAVCLGRTGAGTRPDAHVFLGTTAMEVARSVEGAAVWTVR
ncbi:MAG: universal stress protein [Desulfovibrionaceae bacterium]